MKWRVLEPTRSCIFLLFRIRTDDANTCSGEKSYDENDELIITSSDQIWIYNVI